MPTDAQCILVTGVGHSGTRLVVQMFTKHTDVSVPVSMLNAVQEYEPLHRFFIEAMDVTPISADKYVIDRNDLTFILDSYVSGIDISKKYFVIKMPYYPLNCLEMFVDYFNGNVSLVYVDRPKEKIVKSYLRRGEDRYFSSPVERIRQVKKLGLEGRKRYLASGDVVSFFDELVVHSATKRRRWDQDNPDHTFIQVDIEQFSTSREYLGGVLQELGLSRDPIDEMLSVVNASRLLRGKKNNRLDGILRQILPPFVLSCAVRFRERIDA